MKRLYYVSKIEDKSLIKIAEFYKDLNIMKDFKKMRVSIRNYFNMKEIHV